MIEISRSAVRTFRAVLKKIATVGGTREAPTRVVFRADHTGLHVQARNSQLALEYCQPGSFDAEELAVPAEALADVECRKDTAVRFEANQGCVVANWLEKAVPQIRQYAVVDPDTMPQMPLLPTRMDRQPIELLGALRDASETAGTDVIRYAVNCLQLRGKAGQVVSTDGRQMLAQSGYPFGWDDDVLIPASPVFGCRELSGLEPVRLGRTDLYVTLTIGAWTLHLTIEKHARFPNVDRVLAGSKKTPTALQIDPGDAEFLLGNLNSLPGAKEDYAPITVEGNGQVIVRSRETEQVNTTEIVLARSSTQGRAVGFVTDRHYLAHALRLGFRRIHVVDADQPVVCRDEKRQYLWQVLGKDTMLKASAHPIRLSSTDETALRVPAPVAVLAPATPAVHESDSAASKSARVPHKSPAPQAPLSAVTSNGSDRAGIATVLAEAEAIKDLLHQAFSRTHQLVVSVKRYRRQAQAVRTALGSLRHLQEVAD